MKIGFWAAVVLTILLLASLAFADHYKGDMSFLNDMVSLQRIKCFEKADPDKLYRCEVLINPVVEEIYVALFHDSDEMVLYKVWRKTKDVWTLIYPQKGESS